MSMHPAAVAYAVTVKGQAYAGLTRHKWQLLSPHQYEGNRLHHVLVRGQLFDLANNRRCR